MLRDELLKIETKISQRINGADDAKRALIEHVRVDHRRFNIGMTEEFLHSADVLPGFQ